MRRRAFGAALLVALLASCRPPPVRDPQLGELSTVSIDPRSRLTIIYAANRWECPSCQVGVVEVVKEIAPRLPGSDFVLVIPARMTGDVRGWPGRVQPIDRVVPAPPQVIGRLLVVDSRERVLCFRVLTRGQASIAALRSEVEAAYSLTAPVSETRNDVP